MFAQSLTFTRTFFPEIPKHCPETLANLVTKCWQENQWDRPSISSVLEFLHEFPENEWPMEEK